MLVRKSKHVESEEQARNAQRDEHTRMGLPFSKHNIVGGQHPAPGLTRASNAVAGPSQVTNHYTSGPSMHNQRESYQQDRDRRAHKRGSMSTNRRHFQCQICLEEHGESSVTPIDSCGHKFCVECITSYVGYQLDERQFPILCPTCTAENRRDDPGGV